MDSKVFLSDKYKIKLEKDGDFLENPVHITLLSDGTQNNIELPEEIYKEYDGLGMGTKTLKTYFSSFEFDERAVAEVSFSDLVESVKIKPDIPGLRYSFENGVLTFETEETAFFYIEPDGDIFGGLHIFCNKAKDVEKNKKNIIEFSEGVYTSENCEYIRINEHGIPVIDNVLDDTLIYIAEGAVVNAAIELAGCKNVKIAGCGMLSLIDRCHGADTNFSDERMWGAFRYNAKPSIYIRSGCTDIEIEDVILNCEFRGICIRNSRNISIKNVKMFTSTENADGINCLNACNLLVDGCYIQSSDDCFCMYNSCDSIPTLGDEEYAEAEAVCRNVEVKNCIMSTNCRPVVIGGHATGAKEPRCVIEDVHMHDCEIIYTPYRIFGNTEEYSMYWSGFLRLLSQSEQIVRNITFENITVWVTKGHNGKPVHIEVRGSKNASYTENQGYKIENIKFKNISITESTDMILPSLIRCREAIDEKDECCISDITFENFLIAGQKISDKQILLKGNVHNVKI